MTKCLHEDEVIYGDLFQEDGQPQYNVWCTGCGRSGVILLDEGDNIFDGKPISQDKFWKQQGKH